MKVLYVGLARSVWLFDLRLLNPQGISIQPMLDKLKERYSFAAAPKNPLDLDAQMRALSFKTGIFRGVGKPPVIVNFAIYNDGFVAETLSSTEDASLFLREVSDWIYKEFGLTVPRDVETAYLSQIDYECDFPLVGLSPRLGQLRQLIEGHHRPVDGKSRSFDAATLAFWTEDINQPKAPAAFRVERKIGPAFSSNHYFSQAPLETSSHIELLRQLEQLLKP